MGLKSQPKAYIFTRAHRSPYVVATGIPHKPQRVETKQFAIGEVVKGRLISPNGKPAFVLVAGTIVVPLSVIKEVVTKEVVEPDTSSAAGSAKEKPEVKLALTDKAPTAKKPTIAYIDAMILGALVGCGAVYFAEKKGYITTPDKKNFMYGGIAGAVLAAYLVFRNKNT